MPNRTLLEVVIHEPQQRYTNNDDISGELNVHTVREFPIERVVVKCRCREIVKARGAGGAEEVHKHYTSELTLYPVQAGQGFGFETLPEGVNPAHYVLDPEHLIPEAEATASTGSADGAGGDGGSAGGSETTAVDGGAGAPAAELSASDVPVSASASDMALAHGLHGGDAGGDTILPKGWQKFDFSFRLPADQTLPETFKSSDAHTEGEIVWDIEAVIYRRKVFSVNITASKRFWFVPLTAAGPPVLEGESAPRRQNVRFSPQVLKAYDTKKSRVSVPLLGRFLRSRRPVIVHCSLQHYDAGLQQPPAAAGIELVISTDAEGLLTLVGLKLTLRALTTVYINGQKSVVESRAPVAKLQPNVLLGTTELTLTDLLDGQSLVLPHPVYGSFETRFLEHRYSLIVELGLASTREIRHVRTRTFEHAVTALPVSTLTAPAKDDVDGTRAWQSLARSHGITDQGEFNFTDNAAVRAARIQQARADAPPPARGTKATATSNPHKARSGAAGAADKKAKPAKADDAKPEKAAAKAERAAEAKAAADKPVPPTPTVDPAAQAAPGAAAPVLTGVAPAAAPPQLSEKTLDELAFQDARSQPEPLAAPTAIVA